MPQPKVRDSSIASLLQHRLEHGIVEFDARLVNRLGTALVRIRIDAVCEQNREQPTLTIGADLRACVSRVREGGRAEVAAEAERRRARLRVPTERARAPN